MSTATIDRWLTCAEAAEEMRLKPQTLAKWAMSGHGPKFKKINARVARYRLSDVQIHVTAE